MEYGEWGALRTALERQIASLQAKLAKAQNALAALDEVFRDGALSATPHSEPTPSNPVEARSDNPYPPKPPQVPEKKTRISVIEDLMRAWGGKALLTQLVDALDEMGSKPDDMSRSQFYNTVDSALRSGSARGRFRKGDRKGEWELAPSRKGTTTNH